MKSLFFITVVCLLLTALPTLAQSGQPGQPKLSNLPDENFISECEDWFLGRYGEDFSQAFAARFGYGTGTLTDPGGEQHSFTWFAFTNTDAYLQFYVNCNINQAVARELRSIIDDLGRKWETICFGENNCWISTSNCWMLNDADEARSKNYHYMHVSLGLTIAKMVENTNFINNMTVVGYYQ
ncbi:hypothetical protein KKH39_01095 [Patescibacteria group bacterium]|nr:hypothetical protein [Patescibacteria group bacterium]